MTPTRILELALYNGLLIGALIFSRQSFESYFNEKTDYSIKREPLSKDDLPTLTICLGLPNNDHIPMEYGETFQIGVWAAT